MKTRWGFVSNSSSSSFCIIGVEDMDLAMELAKLEGLVDDGGYISLGHGVGIGNVVCIYGSDEPFWAGIEAKPLLKKMTLPKAIKHFKKLIKDNFGLDIPLSSIDLQYGEAGDG